MVRRQVAPPRGAPDVEAGQGLAHGHRAVGLDPVMVPGHRPAVAVRRLARRTIGVPGVGVVDVEVDRQAPAHADGVRVAVGGGAQPQPLAQAAGELVGVGGAQPLEVEDGTDRHVAVAEHLPGVRQRERPTLLEAGDAVRVPGEGGVGDVQVERHRRRQAATRLVVERASVEQVLGSSGVRQQAERTGASGAEGLVVVALDRSGQAAQRVLEAERVLLSQRAVDRGQAALGVTAGAAAAVADRDEALVEPASPVAVRLLGGGREDEGLDHGEQARGGQLGGLAGDPVVDLGGLPGGEGARGTRDPACHPVGEGELLGDEAPGLGEPVPQVERIRHQRPGGQRVHLEADRQLGVGELRDRRSALPTDAQRLLTAARRVAEATDHVPGVLVGPGRRQQQQLRLRAALGRQRRLDGVERLAGSVGDRSHATFYRTGVRTQQQRGGGGRGGSKSVPQGRLPRA